MKHEAKTKYFISEEKCWQILRSESEQKCALWLLCSFWHKWRDPERSKAEGIYSKHSTWWNTRQTHSSLPTKAYYANTTSAWELSGRNVTVRSV